jgi:uncharacterized protein (TIGR00251 family)
VIDVKDADGGASFAVKASAGGKRNVVVGEHGEALKVAVSAPRDRGKANEALIEVIAKALGVPRKAVSLVKGETSTDKRFLVAGMKAESLRRLLNQLVELKGGAR